MISSSRQLKDKVRNISDGNSKSNTQAMETEKNTPSSGKTGHTGCCGTDYQPFI